MKGFTLIELLVVVLIIGVLSAVALPQYQKAVEKSRISALFPIARALETAQKAYYMANGAFSNEMSNLDISVPLPHSGTPACELAHASSDSSRWDEQTVVTLNNRPSAGSYFVAAARHTGPFTCSGIKIPLADVASLEPGRVYCYEHVRGFTGTAGDFCQKLMNGTYVTSFDSCRFYAIP
uniref:Pilin n=1 Tax=uncultured Elusimicrobia bacterium TaxID=699876 RepID=A0A650EN01_9BACT|nr:hypothetical protein Elusimicrob2101_0950 [uncultured Elusimicrobia bacterium]